MHLALEGRCFSAWKRNIVPGWFIHRAYLKDIYNHIVQAMEATETCRDLLSGLADLHISNTTYKLNEIMKVLTIISTIFIPLTFIVGVYGMNFIYMPELQFRWGYAIIWVVMLAIAGCMISYFKRKKWF